MIRNNVLQVLSGITLSLAVTAGSLPAVAVPDNSGAGQESAEPAPPVDTVIPTPDPEPGTSEEPAGPDSVHGRPDISPSPEPAEPGENPERGTADWLASLIGPLGAKLGQGLDRLEETGNAQEPTAEEQLLEAKAEQLEGTGDTSPAAPPAAARMAAAAAWQPAGIQGIDVSSHQFNVDWPKAWNQGARFAYVKATEATSYINPYYPQQYNGSRNVGMYRGAYHFAIPNVSSGAEQAHYFVNNGGGWSADGWTLPPLLDIEYNPYASLGNTCYNMSPSAMVSWIRDFSQTIKARTGRLPMIYSTTDWWNRCTGNSSAFADHPLHIANYNNVGPGTLPAGWRNWNVWQYSSTGPFVGDSNVWNGSAAALRDFAARAPQTTSIASAADVVAIRSDGTLLNYRASGTGQLYDPIAIGTGWAGTISVHSTDWNADGVYDLLAQDPSGNLNVYYGYPTGGFSGPVRVGSGWGQLRITAGRWDASARFPGVAAFDPRGRGFYYPNTTGGALSAPPTRLGTGFEDTLAAMLDFNGDGTQELLLRLSNGDLVSRQRTQDGTAGQPRTVGVGWQGVSAIRNTSGFSGQGSAGLVAAFGSGELRYYPAARNSWLAPSKIGEGWNTFLLANTQRTVPAFRPSIGSKADVVALGQDGRLLVYRPTATGLLHGPAVIGEGFRAVKSLHATDWNGDGVMDVVVQWQAGTITVYPGARNGGFGAPRTVGSAGWGNLTVYLDPVVSGSGLPGLLARDSQGVLRRYTNPDGASLLQGGYSIGQGWNGLELAVLNWDGDGHADVLAVRPDGQMAYYKRAADGGFASVPPRQVGVGWNIFRSIATGADVTGVGGESVLGIDRSGNLYNYQVTGSGSWADSRTLGLGWSGLTLAGSN